jgi:hypothetical protein
MAHIHAALMAEYAKDAAEIDEPWTRWQHLSIGGSWDGFYEHPAWRKHVQYRRRPAPAPTKTLYQWAFKYCNGWFMTAGFFETAEQARRVSGDSSTDYRRLDYTALEVPE